MKKYFKYFIVLLFTFATFMSSIDAVTIKETLINGDGYDTIQDGSIVIGVTKFDPTTVVTGGRATKAGSDAAVIYLKENGSLEGYEAPVIYVLAGGSWYALDKDNNAALVTDSNIIDELSNKMIFFVNDEEKIIDLDMTGISVDEEKLPKGVTYKDGKLYVKATAESFDIVDTKGNEIKFIREGDVYSIDQSACYTLDGTAIIDYNSNSCSPHVGIPKKVNGVQVDSIGANAFRNKGIKSVLIPGNINSLGDNAFADNELENVIIEDKYDETSFEYYGQNVFGTFEDVYYKNDLTDLLAQFKDEITLKVRKGTMTDEIDSEIYNDNIHRLPGFAKYLELKRLGLVRDIETGLFNNKYYIYYGFDYDDETYETKADNFVVAVGFYDNAKQKNYEVKKYVSYTVEEVDSENEDYKKIKQEYEDYFETIREKVENKDYSVNLLGYEKLFDLADKYGYSISQESSGIGDGGSGYISGNETYAFAELIYDDVMYAAYFEAPYFMAIPYAVELEELPETKEEIYDAMISKFEQDTQMTDYEVLVKNSWTNAAKLVTYYQINISDNETNNLFALEISVPTDKGVLIEDGSYENDGKTRIYYSYIPTKTLEEYNGKVSDYIDFVTEELKAKANLNDGSRMYLSGGSSSGVYTFNISTETDNVLSSYSFIVDNSSVGPITGFGNEKVYYELDLDSSSIDGGYFEYITAAVEQFSQEKSLTDYLQTVSSTYMKDPVTNKFSYYNGTDGVDVYLGVEIIDFSTNTIYVVVFPHY